METFRSHMREGQLVLRILCDVEQRPAATLEASSFAVAVAESGNRC